MPTHTSLISWRWYNELNSEQAQFLPARDVNEQQDGVNQLTLLHGEKWCRWPFPGFLGRGPCCANKVKTTTELRYHILGHKTGLWIVTPPPGQPTIERLALVEGFYIDMYRDARAAFPDVFPRVEALEPKESEEDKDGGGETVADSVAAAVPKDSN